MKKNNRFLRRKGGKQKPNRKPSNAKAAKNNKGGKRGKNGKVSNGGSNNNGGNGQNGGKTGKDDEDSGGSLECQIQVCRYARYVFDLMTDLFIAIHLISLLRCLLCVNIL